MLCGAKKKIDHIFFDGNQNLTCFLRWQFQSTNWTCLTNNYHANGSSRVTPPPPPPYDHWLLTARILWMIRDDEYKSNYTIKCYQISNCHYIDQYWSGHAAMTARLRILVFQYEALFFLKSKIPNAVYSLRVSRTEPERNHGSRDVHLISTGIDRRVWSLVCRCFLCLWPVVFYLC